MFAPMKYSASRCSLGEAGGVSGGDGQFGRGLGGGPAGAAQEVLVAAVGAVHPRAVHAGRDEALEEAGRIGGGAARGEDLRPAMCDH